MKDIKTGCENNLCSPSGEKGSKEIKLLITDFDGTLVDTFEANFCAYQVAFKSVELQLTQEEYKNCFGFRFERFMKEMGIVDKETALRIKEEKAKNYPDFFHLLKVNQPLLLFLQAFKRNGGKIAIASTARKQNLLNVLEYLNLSSTFDYQLAGEDVVQGKPHPEIYIKVMQHFNINPQNTLIFEDTEIGLQAAEATGAMSIKINAEFYGN